MVVLDRQFSSWASIEAGVPRGSRYGLLLSLIYINDLSDSLITNAELFFFCSPQYEHIR